MDAIPTVSLDSRQSVPEPAVVVDIETRSLLDLKEVGTPRYAAEPSTDVWCVALMNVADNAPLGLWRPGDPVPDLIGKAKTLIAHNAAFEIAIFRHVLGPKYGWPIPPVETWRCTMVECLAMALPAKLKRVADVLGLEHRKADDGIMHRCSKPRPPRRGEDPAGVYWFDDSEHLETLFAYCAADVECERDLWRWLSC
jgi:DNA polymerase